MKTTELKIEGCLASFFFSQTDSDSKNRLDRVTVHCRYEPPYFVHALTCTKTNAALAGSLSLVHLHASHSEAEPAVFALSSSASRWPLVETWALLRTDEMLDLL